MTTISLGSSLASCRANARNGEVLGRQIAAKARGGGIDLGAEMAGGQVGGGALSGLLGGKTAEQSAKQYGLYKDWAYTVINAIARRISGCQYGAGTLTKEASKSASPSGTKDQKPELTRGEKAFRRKIKQDLMQSMRLPVSIKQQTSNGRAIDQIESHPALDFLQRPNGLQGKTEFLQCTIINLFLTGVAYWVGGKTGDGENANDFELWAIPTSWLKPVHDGKLFSSYLLQMPGMSQPLPMPKELVHRIYLPDPQDFKTAISPVNAEGRAVRIDEHIQQSQLDMFEQGIFPQLMVSVGDRKGPDGQNLGAPTLTGAQRRQIVRGIREIIRSAVSNRDPFIIDGLISGVSKLSNTANEMDWLNSGEQVKKRIFQAFGINPIIVGEIQGVNRAQAAVADQSYVDNVVNPLGDKITCALQDFVTPMFDKDNDTTEGLALWLEEATPKDEELDLRKASQGRADGAASRNEHRAVLRLPPIDGDAADLTGLASTAAGAAQVTQVLVTVANGQIPPNAAKSLLTSTYGYSEEQAGALLKGIKPIDRTAGGFPGQPGQPAAAGGESGGGEPPQPKKPPKKPPSDGNDDAGDAGTPAMPKVDDGSGGGKAMAVIEKSARTKLTRGAVKSTNARLRTSLEREAAAGLIPFFTSSSSGLLNYLLDEVALKSTRQNPTRQPPE